ncbi:MAG: hypothetical protein AAFV62_11150, partial [Pseudomonadota bacterium]
MVSLTPPFRRAVVADAPVLAELIGYASEGMAPYLWSTMGEAGQTLSEAEAFAIGTERIASRINTQQIVVVGEPGHAEAALMGYAVEAEDPITSETPAMFQPLTYQLPTTWFSSAING